MLYMNLELRNLVIKYMCFQSIKFNDFDDDATRWLCILIYTYIYICVYIRLCYGF